MFLFFTDWPRQPSQNNWHIIFICRSGFCVDANIFFNGFQQPHFFLPDGFFKKQSIRSNQKKKRLMWQILRTCISNRETSNSRQCETENGAIKKYAQAVTWIRHFSTWQHKMNICRAGIALHASQSSILSRIQTAFSTLEWKNIQRWVWSKNLYFYLRFPKPCSIETYQSMWIKINQPCCSLVLQQMLHVLWMKLEGVSKIRFICEKFILF